MCCKIENQIYQTTAAEIDEMILAAVLVQAGSGDGIIWRAVDLTEAAVLDSVAMGIWHGESFCP